MDFKHCVIKPKQGEKAVTAVVLEYLSCRDFVTALCRLADGTLKTYLPVRLKVYQTEEEAQTEARRIDTENDAP